ncbi:hypothetical protein EX895_004710 [Sporisorium graminicola]|uniref:Cellulase n=1 Tax=Sporisorium graminicola TaxID=280036 RepID=A0A4U7KQ97_9BASI|nr:hypothetical protein EX895_004710 [Sporisorium graminicola]TKY86561.1 hypothetical protein EX895_004710 [Sporisorium graminicola]
MAVKISIGLLALSLTLSLVHLEGASAGMATRYWDCCRASASWMYKAPVYAPVDVCKADGVTLIDPKTANSGGRGHRLCFYAEFAHDAQGKSMKRNKLIFQVTNVGGDVQSQNFDFQIPGGGLGAFIQGCPKQWGDKASDWGETYGGVKSSSQCANLPETLQEGCKWRFSNWGDNPVMKGSPKRVRCPKSLIDRSGCQRKDDNTISPFSGKVDSGNTAAPAKYKRDRSVCLAGGSKKGSSADAESEVGTGVGTVAGAGAADGSAVTSADGSSDGSKDNAEDDSKDAVQEGSQGGSVISLAPSADGQGDGSAPEDYQPTVPKKHNVCRNKKH